MTGGNYNELKPSIYVSMKQEMNEDVWMKQQSALLSPTTLHLRRILGGGNETTHYFGLTITKLCVIFISVEKDTSN